MRARLFALVLASWFVAAPAFGQQTILHFKSQPGDWVGQGQELTLTSADAEFLIRPTFSSAVGFFVRNSTNFWSGAFAPIAGSDLVVGAYENAARFPFQASSQPGLSFSGNGRGCNRLTGRFDVLEAVVDVVTEAVISFAVDFEQHCEGGVPALFGSIRFNSDVPLPNLLPPRITLVNALNTDRCVEATGPDGATVSLTGSGISPDPVDFLWSASTGDTGFGPDFSFQLGVDQTAQVILTIEDLATGEQASSSLSVCTSDTTPPQITIFSPSAGQTFVGEDAVLSVAVSDLVDKSIGGFRLRSAETATVPLDASTGTSSTLLFRKIIGETIEIEITVEAEDFSGNTGADRVTIFRAHDLGLAN